MTNPKYNRQPGLFKIIKHALCGIATQGVFSVIVLQYSGGADGGEFQAVNTITYK